VKWYTAISATIGIVLIKRIDGHKAYIGIGQGVSEKRDMHIIAQNGGHFFQGPQLWPNIKEWAA
jgi:hypothetical protein